MAEPLWTIPEIAAAMETPPIWPTHRPSPHGIGSSVEAVAASFPLPEGEGQGEGGRRADFRQTLPSIPISGVSIDSRTLKHGDLFFAIKGERMDGHKFIAAAFDKGAGGAVVEQGFEPPSSSCAPLFCVPDTLEAMNALARQSRKRSKARIVAVTGSVGKTGTKEMLRTMLSASGATHASEKSYNNLWGVPLSLALMPKEAAFGVFEIGMNHAGEITPLTRLVRPEMRSSPGWLRSILSSSTRWPRLPTRKPRSLMALSMAGSLFSPLTMSISLGSRHVRAQRMQLVTFGESPGVDARLLGYGPVQEGAVVTADILGSRLTFRIRARGRHLALNAIAALAATELAGASVEAAAKCLAG